jgi:hypothetical protein
MNVVDYWKKLVANCQSYKDFSSEDFIEKLNENVPDWRLQVKDKNLWPELHSHSQNVAESYYLSVIINEAGLDFAYFLIQSQWGKKHLDASQALSYCCEHINEWNSFPDFVKEKVLDCELRIYLNECLQDVNIWQSLTEKQKSNIFDNLSTEEEKYVSDIILFKLWAEELDYKNTPYIIFETDLFKRTLKEIIHQRDRDDHYFEMIEHRLKGWDIPTVRVVLDSILSYHPSEKLQLLKEVAESCNDQSSIAIIDKITSKIQNKLRL